MSPALPALIDQYERSQPGFLALNDGKKMRYAVVNPAGPAHATVLITPGRREFIEKKYIELGPAFLARGFRLILMEWRGQGLSSRAFEGARHQRDHIDDFTQHMNDLQQFYETIVKPNQIGKLVINGHSMGSHLLVRWLAENPDLPVAGAFITAPMMALAGPLAHASASLLSWSSSKLGYGEDYAPMQHDYNDDDRAFANNPLTHDPERFALIDRYFTAYPDMVVGGVTWDWLQASIKSMYHAQRRHRLERIKTPILAIVGNEDRVTPPDEIIRFLKMMPQAETILIPGSRHDVMNEIDPCRDEAWRQVDGFLKKIV